GSQTLGGAYSLARTTLGQMAVRIALQCNEQDSLLILGEDNPAARLLTRPGEAIYNDAGGLVENNSTFQVVWLGDAVRDRTLERIREKGVRALGEEVLSPIVFEGQSPAPADGNELLERELATLAARPSEGLSPVALIGEPLAIKGPTSIELRRETGMNVLAVTPQAESAMAMLSLAAVSSVISGGSGSRLVIIDSARKDEAEYGVWPRLLASAGAGGASIQHALPDEIEGVFEQLGSELDRRKQGEVGEPVFVVVYGLHRCTALKAADDGFGGFSFGGSESEQGHSRGQASKRFADLLAEGSEMGMHVLTWCDSASSLERMLGRSGAAHFEARILMQMSQSDSISLMDAPAASRLGLHRALLYHEQSGSQERFRPYVRPSTKWVRGLFTS
ncbi:MAG: ATP-binding protein, partial [Planctomycetota bacterium]